MRWVVFVLLLLTASARADDIVGYETEGDADAGGSDPRVAALDEAFARAARQAVDELLDAESRKANKGPIDKEIVGRARLWVAKFTVTKDETAEGRRQLTVMVRVDKDKMRARLVELNIALTAAPAVTSKSVVVLLRVTSPEATRATFGANAEKDPPGMSALSQALRGAALSPKRGPTTASAKNGELPFDDGDAEAIASDAKADAVAIASVVVGEPVVVRGVPAQGVLVHATVRFIQAGKALQGSASVASRGTEATVINAAIDRALAAAASDVLPAPKSSLSQAPSFSGDDVPVKAEGVVLVRLSPKTPWGMVLAEQKYLVGAKGVQKAVIRRLSPGGWVIGVTTTESLDRIAQIARKPPASDTSVKVKVVGEVIEVSMSGSP